MTSILFVCTANRYRSPIAAACFKDELGKRERERDWQILSAGTWTTNGLPAMPEAILEARLLGLDIRAHRSQVVTQDLVQKADLILVMERGQKEALQVEFPAHRHKVALLTEVADGSVQDISDPVMNPSEVGVVSQIQELIQTGFENICELAAKNATQA